MKTRTFLPSSSNLKPTRSAFFVAGFVALACAWAAAGALSSRAEDVQATGSPLTFLLIGVFVVGLTAEGTVRDLAADPIGVAA